MPLLRHESFEVGALAAQQLASSDERGHYHAKLRPVLADPDTPTAVRIAIMEAMTRSFAPANNFLHDYTLSLSQIIQDGKSTPELKQNALVQLHTLIKTHPPGTVQEIVTGPIYTLHLSYLKTDPEGILFDVVNREAVPKWAEYLEPIYHELVTTYPAYMAKHEARRLIAEQNKLKKQTTLLHDKSQPASVRHQLFNTVGRHPEEAARFATDPENDEKMRTAAIERLLRVVMDTQQKLDPDLDRLAKVVQQVSGENGESAAKSRAIQFKELISKNYPATFSKVFSEAR